MTAAARGDGHGVPADVATWVESALGPVAVLADTSWPRESSRVWQVRVTGAEAYLKISPSAEAFATETEALSTVVPAARIEAPRLLASSRAHRALVLSAVPGVVVRTLAPAPASDVERDVHRRAGAAIRALHRTLPAGADAPKARADRLAALLRRVGEHERAAAPALAADDRRVLVAARDAVTDGAAECTLGMLHGDFQPRNWLWSADTGQVALIDFEAVAVGFCVEDMAWLTAATWPTRPDLRAAFLDGYGRALTPQEHAVLTGWTALASLEHIADGVRLDIPVKVANGRRALAAARAGLVGAAP